MSSPLSNLMPQTDYSHLIEPLLPQVRAAVRWACQRAYHQATPDEIDELSQRILLRLMEQNYRRLRSFEQKSSLSTWLKAIAARELSNHLHRQIILESLEEIAPDELVCQSAQEEVVFAQERQEALRAAISKLTTRERQLLRLYFEDELKAIEIAALLKIKVDSVYCLKYEILAKLRGFMMIREAV